jgi:hypothetical protein
MFALGIVVVGSGVAAGSELVAAGSEHIGSEALPLEADADLDRV